MFMKTLVTSSDKHVRAKTLYRIKLRIDKTWTPVPPHVFGGYVAEMWTSSVCVTCKSPAIVSTCTCTVFIPLSCVRSVRFVLLFPRHVTLWWSSLTDLAVVVCVCAGHHWRAAELPVRHPGATGAGGRPRRTGACVRSPHVVTSYHHIMQRPFAWPLFLISQLSLSTTTSRAALLDIKSATRTCTR